MKFRVFSDLHLEYNGITEHLFELQINNPVDYLILAGDIATLDTLDLLENFFEKLNYKKIFYVLGNHEYYSKDKIKNVSEIYKNLCDKYGIILLDNNSYKINNIKIVGSTLWSNISKEGYNFISDKLYMSQEEIIDMHKKCINYLENELSEENTIVITHHMPSKIFVDKKYKIYDNSAYASNCEHLFKQGITHWIYGHTHTKFRKLIGNIEFVCNSYGYPRENDNSNYECLIEIKNV